MVAITARQVAKEGWEALEEQRAGVDTLPQPISLTFRELVQRGRGEGESPEEGLRESLWVKLRGLACSEVLADYVQNHSEEERVSLFLDALDELPEEGPRNIWRC